MISSLKDKMLFTLPNMITFARILFLVPIVLFFNQENFFMAFLFVALGGISDFFDGKIARYLKQESHFGAIFDPITDRIFTLFLVSFLFYYKELPFLYFIVTFFRHFSQLLSLPILTIWLKKTFYVRPKAFPKWASALNFILFAFCFFQLIPIPIFKEVSSQMSFLKMALILISGFMELKILVTYLPRLYQIATDKHDTFE